MSTPFSVGAKSLHEQSIEAIIKATEAARMNEQAQVKMYIQTAKLFSDLTARKLKAMGMHRQADEYLKSLDEHINRVLAIAEQKHHENNNDRMQKAKKASFQIRKSVKTQSSCKCMKSECTCKCATIEKAACQCSFLNKGIINPYVGESPARREYTQTGSVQSTWQVGQVKANPQHAYKMIHELTGEQQKQLQNKFPQGELTRYAYPVHRDTSELVHGQRIPLPPGYAVRAHAQAFRELKPEHKRGAFVQIHAPGHSAHGKKGIVQGPNPNVPGKVKIQIGHTENHSIYVDPHQVRLSKAVTRMEKALQTIWNVRKAFMKSESANDTTKNTQNSDAGGQSHSDADPAHRNDA
jgi:hypothetical protein